MASQTSSSAVPRMMRRNSSRNALRDLLGRDWGTALLFMTPTLLLLGGLVAYPFVRALWISFTRTRGQDTGSFIGLANYRFLWTDRFFRESVLVTVKLTAYSGFFKLAISILAALLLHRLGSRADAWTGLILLPWIVPTIVRAITWRGLLDPLYGGLNQILLSLGLIERAVPFFGQMSTALASVICVDVWQGVPFFVINLLAGLKAIDRELYEAASIDGASGWRQFLHITLPSLRYVLLVVTLLSTIWTFNAFELVYLLTGGGPMNATKVYSVLAYGYATRGRNFGLATAVAMSMAPVFVLTILWLGRYMLGNRLGDTGLSSGKQSRYRPSRVLTWPLGALVWPMQMLWLGLSLGLWALNDAVERFLSAAVAALTLWRPNGVRRWQRAWRQVSHHILPTVVLVVLLIYEIGPFYWVIITAFKSELQITRWVSVLWPKPWTLDQFRVLLRPELNFIVWLKNTLIVSVVTPLLSTGCASLAAYAMMRLRWRGSRLVANAVLVSYLMPGIMMLIPIYQFFIRLHLVNTLFGLVICYPIFCLPFAIWLLMGYYNSIPEELEAAAMIDGCNRFQTFYKVVLPLTKPALLATALFGVTQAWNEFLYAATLIRSESKMTIALGLATLTWGDVSPWGQLCAATLLMSIPVLILYAAGQRFMVAGLTAGAVKG